MDDNSMSVDIMQTIMIFLILILIGFCCGSCGESMENYPVRKIPRPDASTTYVIEDGGYSFFDSKSWCDGLNGQLPIIKSQDDFDFLMDKVVKNNSAGYTSQVWLGMTPIGYSKECKTWLDDSPFDYVFPKYDLQCLSCRDMPCCALFVYGKPTRVYKWVSVSSCSELRRRVCVIHDRHFKTETSSSNNSQPQSNSGIIWAIITCTILSSLVISGVIIGVAMRMKLIQRNSIRHERLGIELDQIVLSNE